MNYTRTALTTLVLLLLVAPAGAADWKGKDVDKDGVLHVMNPAMPTESPIEMEPSQLWQLGGDTDDEDEFFGVIAEIAVDPDGNVYLLDSQLNQVMIYTGDGEFIRAIGHEGEGPGEFRRPGDMLLLPGGNVGVVQFMPGKIVMLTPEGVPADNFPVPGPDGGGTQFFSGCESAGDHVVVAVNEFARDDTGFRTIFRLVGVSPDGEQSAQYYQIENKRDMANFVFDEKETSGMSMQWGVGTDGRVYASTVFDDYRVDVWQLNGTPDRVIEREYEPRVRSKEEMDRMNDRIRIRINRTEPEKKISKTDRAIQRLYLRGDGTLWVLSSRGALDAPEDMLGTFDVFDKNGRFLRQVSIKGEGSIKEDGFFFAGDRLFVVTSLVSARMSSFGGGNAVEEDDEDPEPMAVICYDLGPEVHGMR
jgi:hypothetical protein